MYRFAFALVAGLVSTATASPKVVRHPATGIANRYIVVLNTAPAARATASTHATIDRLASTHGAVVGRRYDTALHGFTAELADADVDALAADPAVAFVEQDSIVHATAIQQNATWGLDRIDQAALPVDGRYVQLGDGEGATVYVIDTGIRTTHAELTGRVQAGAFAVQDGNGVEDCNGHGSHVAGTIAGSTFGVAKRATVIPVRVLGCDGSGATSDVIAGIDFVAQNHKPDSVANLSLGGGVSDAEDTAIRNLVAAGVTTVVAAGNDNVDACTQSPAREKSAITVGASTETDSRASFSNFGTCVDVFAPGTNIVSAGIASDTATATLNGTSMATPHVAGAAAAFLSANPGATPAQVAAALTGGGVRDKIGDAKGSPNILLNTAFLDRVAPVTAISSPADGALVPSRFVVDASITERNLERVELTIDGTLAGSLTPAAGEPVRFAVDGLADGSHTLVLTAIDLAGQSTTEEITIRVGDVPGGDDGDGSDEEIDGGCSTGGTGGLVMALGIAAALITRRRRR